MKWVNSRRFAICLICLAIIAAIVVLDDEAYIPVIGYLVPVLVAFMGATTVEKVGEEFGKMKWDDRRLRGDRNAESDEQTGLSRKDGKDD